MIKIIKGILYFFTAMSLLLIPCIASAAEEEMNCTSDSSAYTLNLGNIFAEDNVQPGNILFADSHEVQVTCTSSGNYQQVSEVSNSGWSSSGMTVSVDGLTCPVIDEGTAISDSGLGIAWTNYNSANGTWTCMSNAFSGSSIRRGLRSNGTTTLTDKIYIVKTNKDIGYGETSELSQTVFVDEADADRVSRGHLYSFSFSGTMTIAAGGCTIDNTVNVDMGTLSSSTLSGIGSTGPDVPFSILLQDCRGVTTVAHLDFTPIYGYADASKGVVALNDGDNAATGAGIQLLMNGKEIAGFNDNVYSISKGDNSIPFIARYYQTGETVSPGNADTVVVFNIFYN